MLLFPTASNAAAVAPGVDAVNFTLIKSNFMHLIHQADIQINGKTIENIQPFMNVVKHSVNDLATIGCTQGLGESADNLRSIVCNNAAAATASCFGSGFTNNKIVNPNGSRICSIFTSIQNSTALNDAIT